MVEIALRYSAAGKVDGLQHAARGQDPEHRVQVGIVGADGFVERISQRLVRVHFQLKSLQGKCEAMM